MSVLKFAHNRFSVRLGVVLLTILSGHSHSNYMGVPRKAGVIFKEFSFKFFNSNKILELSLFSTFET